jgi:two-component system, chemotaxis family, chemotaxis protein CheY
MAHALGDVEVEHVGPGLLNADGSLVSFLIVDDSRFAREILRDMVESFGGDLVGEADNGAAAIAEYERLHPDVVLMDISMPVMDGITAVEKLFERHPDACVIMVSSVGYQENIAVALQRGARHFVQKPVKPEVLHEVIQYVLAGKRY